MCFPFRRKKQQGDFGYQLFINRDADSFNPEHSVVYEFHFKAEDFEANYAPRTSTARVRVRLKPKAVPSVFAKYLFKPFPRRKRVKQICKLSFYLTLFILNSFFIVFSGHSLRQALFVYRLIGATFIGNFIEDPFLN